MDKHKNDAFIVTLIHSPKILIQPSAEMKCSE